MEQNLSLARNISHVYPQLWLLLLNPLPHCKRVEPDQADLALFLLVEI